MKNNNMTFLFENLLHNPALVAEVLVNGSEDNFNEILNFFIDYIEGLAAEDKQSYFSEFLFQTGKQLKAETSNRLIKIINTVGMDYDINQPNKDGITPLMAARKAGHENMVKFLLDNLLRSPGLAADVLVSGSEDDLNKILDFVPDYIEGLATKEKKSYLSSLLFQAGKNFNEVTAERLKKIIDMSGNSPEIGQPNKDGITPLMAACKAGHEKMVSFLVNLLMDKLLDNPHLAADVLVSSSEEDFNKILVDLPDLIQGLATEEKKSYFSSLLFQAGKNFNAGTSDRLQKIIDMSGNSPEIGQPNKDGITPLMAACKAGHEKMVNFLVENLPFSPRLAIDVQVSGSEDTFNKTLDFFTIMISGLSNEGKQSYFDELLFQAGKHFKAGTSDRLKKIIDLVGQGYDVNQVDKDGITPLMAACSAGHEGIVKFLLEKLPTEINQVNYLSGYNTGQTALRKALESKNYSIAKILIDKGAELLPMLFDSNYISKISKIIFTDSEGSKNSDKKHITQSNVKSEIIYNNHGYEDKLSIYGDKEGNILSAISASGETLPISYSIHLPKNNNVKAIIVTVYGGGIVGTTYSSSYREYFLKNNIAVAELNLIDLHKLGNCYQGNMSKELYDSLHLSIHSFYQALKNNQLHSDLDQLTNLPAFLSGCSFGGGITLKYLELYPGEFNGGIVASTSYGLLNATDGPLIGGNRQYSEYIMPSKVSQASLLINNKNDNNVNLKALFCFYEGLKDQINVQLLINDKGDSPHSGIDEHNIGHFLPTRGEEFEATAKRIVDFIGGKYESPNITKWKAYKGNIEANLNFKGATVEEKFIAHVFKRIKKNELNSWELEKVKTIFKIVDYLYSMNTPGLLAAETEYVTKLKDNDIFKNAIKDIYPNLMEYISLTLNHSIDPAWNKYHHDDFWAQQYKDLLNSPKIDNISKVFLLSKLYFSNPDLFNHDKHYMAQNENAADSKFEYYYKRLENTLKQESQLKNEALKDIYNDVSGAYVANADHIDLLGEE